MFYNRGVYADMGHAGLLSLLLSLRFSLPAQHALHRFATVQDFASSLVIYGHLVSWDKGLDLGSLSIKFGELGEVLTRPL